jgi:peptidoglycan hydrolase-like protein with peptidoglycan-binding domain
VPKNQAREVSYEVQTGRSGGSVRVYSTTAKQKKTYGYSSGRNYYATRKAWICDDCYPAYAKLQATKASLKAIGFLAVVSFIAYAFLSEPISSTEKKTTTPEPVVQQASDNSSSKKATEEAILPTTALQLNSASDTKSIQNRLGELGYFQGVIDGAWGPISREALKTFKSRNNLPADYVLDNETQTALFSNGAISTDNPIFAESNEALIKFVLQSGTTLNPNNLLDARKIQGQLNNRGYASDTSGVWNEQARHSLRLFKKDNGLQADDTWDRAVEAKLFEK